jgi:hypothetical protein
LTLPKKIRKIKTRSHLKGALNVSEKSSFQSYGRSLAAFSGSLSILLKKAKVLQKIYGMQRGVLQKSQKVEEQGRN